MGHNITEIMFKTETELQLELFPRNWTETETEIMSGTEISLVCIGYRNAPLLLPTAKARTLCVYYWSWISQTVVFKNIFGGVRHQ